MNMNKRLSKITTTFLEGSPKALIIGQKDFLTTQILEALEKRDCQVFLSDRVIKDLPKVDYIFQFKDFKNTKKLLEKALKEKTRYLMITNDRSFTLLKTFTSEESLRATSEEAKVQNFSNEPWSSKLAKIEKAVFEFNKKGLDARIFRVDSSSSGDSPLLVKQILKTMFSQTHVLPLTRKTESMNSLQYLICFLNSFQRQIFINTKVSFD